VHLLVIGGSDAGIEAGLAARSLDTSLDVTPDAAQVSVTVLAYGLAGDWDAVT
jgi:hypothetical protein